MPDHPTKPDMYYLEVALDVPMRQLYSYAHRGVVPLPGTRVWVPFGQRRLLGIVISSGTQPPPGIRLKQVYEVLDDKPLFSEELVELLDWSSRYYHQSPGEFWAAAMPTVLRRGMPWNHALEETIFSVYQAPEKLEETLKRAPRQLQILEQVIANGGEISATELKRDFPGSEAAVSALLSKKFLHKQKRIAERVQHTHNTVANTLTSDQQQAVTQLDQAVDGFSCAVLEGITGSGKTEVYFALIDQCLNRGRQALVLLPEIALTDQLMARFEVRFGSRVVQVHSGMADAQRYRHWWEISSGRADVVLATRSGVFQDFARLGLIIMDEEHDASYKQQEGVRYHARSIAIKRAQIEEIPIVLGSATPSLESCHNVQTGRYLHVQLKKRVGSSALPTVQMVDLNQNRPESGLSEVSLKALGDVLSQQRQALVFINRRGYAPVVFCPDCQWTATCKRCDAQMTLHQHSHTLQCHHCGAHQGMPLNCSSCGSAGLIELGEGTQKIEESLRTRFPDARIQRFDRDELNSPRKLQEAMQRVHQGEIDILVGTQLLSKGHDFSGVSLVLVVNADQGLHSIDFRAPETLAQQLIQVAGRAGRADARGRVLIQTWLPRHPTLHAVAEHDYRQFAKQELALRQQAGFPPYAHLALWRVRARQPDQPLDYLHHVLQLGQSIRPAQAFCFDPVKSPMFKRSGNYHAQLLCSAERRSDLHRWLDQWISLLEQDRKITKLKWSIDIDPISLF